MFVLPFVSPTVFVQAAPTSTSTSTSTSTPTPTSTPPPTPPPPPPTTPPVDPATGLPVQPIDRTTGRPEVLRDSTGQPLVPRDETGQPLVPRDATGQIVEGPPGSLPPSRAESLLRPGAALQGEATPGDLGGGRIAIGGTGYHGRVAISEGYSTNVTQSQLQLGGPVTVNPGFFTGLDLGLDIITLTSNTDRQEFHFVARGQHYASIDDGTAYATGSRSFTLTPRTVLNMFAMGMITSSNSALLADGPLFQIDPSSITRVYTRENAGLNLSYELGPRWRFVASGIVWVETTVHEARFDDGTSQGLDHHGLDSVSPIVEARVTHDFDPYNIGHVALRYSPTYIAFLADYTRSPPRFDGSATIEAASALAGWTHAYGEYWRSMLSVGGTVSQAPPFDANTQLIYSPNVEVLLTYAKEYWLATATATYSYGTVNPRLGFGPSEGAAVTLQGIPYPHGHWNSLAVFATGYASSATLLQGTGSNRLTFVGANADVRYGVNNWLGVIAAYSLHYATFEGSSLPPTLRNVFLLGLSGYFSTDHSLPTIENLAISTTPPI